MFGGQPPQNPQASTGFSFGAASTTPSAGFSFGQAATGQGAAPTQPTAANTGFTGFGLAGSTGTAAATTAAGGTTGFSFGATTNNAASKAATGSGFSFAFGAQSQAQPIAGTTGSIFGAAGTPSMATTPQAALTTSTPSLGLGSTVAPAAGFGSSPFGLKPSIATAPTASSGPATGLAGFGASTTTTVAASTPGSVLGGLLSSSTAAGYTTSAAATTATTTTAASTGFSLQSTAVTTTAASTAGSGFAFGSTTQTSTAPSLGLRLGSFASTAATTTTASSLSTLAACTTATSSATTGGVGQKQMTFRQLEDTINKWTLELEDQEKFFLDQATQVNAWDRIVMENGEKILQLNKDVETVKLDQQKLDHELDFVHSQQKELQELLVPLEKALGNLPPISYQQHADVEREHTYTLAESLDAQLKRMGQDLKEIIERLNSSNSKPDTNDPVQQITKILNAHVVSLMWVDRNSANLQKRVEEISKQMDLEKREQERNFRLAYS